jgi:hypothetical protein
MHARRRTGDAEDRTAIRWHQAAIARNRLSESRPNISWRTTRRWPRQTCGDGLPAGAQNSRNSGTLVEDCLCRPFRAGRGGGLPRVPLRFTLG